MKTAKSGARNANGVRRKTDILMRRSSTMKTFEATEQAYKNGYEQGKMDALKWIPVSERLPETNGYHVWVIACIDGKRSGVRMFERRTVRGKMVERFKYPWETISNENITHWMPLPEPPKGE
jgi:hypothetical protein